MAEILCQHCGKPIDPPTLNFEGDAVPILGVADRLGALVPELIEALETLFDITPYATNDKDAEIRVRVRALIRKAKAEVSHG